MIHISLLLNIWFAVKKIFISTCMYLLSCVLLSSCAVLREATVVNPVVKKGRPFVIIETERMGGWGIASHPFIRRISDNRLVVTYNLIGDGKRRSEEATAPWPAFYDVDEKTWGFGDPYQWVDGVAPTNVMVSFQEGDPIPKGKNPYSDAVFYGCVYKQNGEYIAYSRRMTQPDFSVDAFSSCDAGKTWTYAGKVPFSVNELDMGRTGWFIIETDAAVDGDVIYLAAYGKKTKNTVRYTTYLFKSTDGGKSYDFVSKIAKPEDAPWGYEGPCEPALTLLPNGEMLCVMRVGSSTALWGPYANIIQYMLVARSSDKGKTWSYSKFKYNGVMPKLLQMSNGVLALAFGRPGNNIVFSLNNGHTWGSEVAVTSPNASTSGYLDIIEVSPGKLLAVYDLYNTDLSGMWLWEPKQVNGVLGRFIDVKRLW